MVEYEHSGTWLEVAMTAAGVTAPQVAEAMGVSVQAVYKWLRTGKIARTHIPKLAVLTRTTPGFLLSGANGEHNVEDGPSVRQLLPLVSWVRAGHWSEVEDPFQPGEFEDRVPATKPHSPRSFALRVVGDSMEPEFREGRIITVDPMRRAGHRSYVIVRQRGNSEVTFKQLIIEGGKKYLKPLNPQYRLMEMEPDAIIVGVVRQQITDYE